MNFKLIGVKLNGDLDEPINIYLNDFLPYNKKWEEVIPFKITEVSKPTNDSLGIIKLNDEFECKYLSIQFEYLDKLVIYFYNESSIVLSQ